VTVGAFRLFHCKNVMFLIQSPVLMAKLGLAGFVAFGIAIFTAPLPAQVAQEKKETYPNFDLRDPDFDGNGAAATRASIRARIGAPAVDTAAPMTRVRANLGAQIPSLKIEMNRAGTAPEAVGTESLTQFLAGASSQPRADVARRFLVQEAGLFGLTNEQAQALVKFSDYANPAGNMSWVEYRQEANGIPIFQGEIRAAFTSQGALARMTGNLAPGLTYGALPTTPALTPAQAAASAASTIGIALDAATIGANAHKQSNLQATLDQGPFSRPTKTELIYFATEPGVATLAYSMVLWSRPSAYHVVVDAADGTLLWRKNITDHQTQTASYNIYSSDSPSPGSPSGILPGQGTQPPAVNRATVTLIGNEPPNTFNNLGWMTDGTNISTGNNVDCGLDITGGDGIDPAGRAIGSPNRSLIFSYDPAPGGTESPSTTNSRNGAVTNLFYWTNVYHDRLYLLGFTEAAKNFQKDNFSRGGIGNDPVSAQVQDSSGTNNANFSTPPDGSSGVMQMYLFTNPTPQRDGSLDADVFIHELTHGLSNRLHHNGGGLFTQQAAGMGEGWSDYYARCLLSTADEDLGGIYPAGAYATFHFGSAGTFTDNYYYGIRRFPYVLKSSVGANGKPFNPTTFADLDFALINALNDGAFPSSPVIGITANEVHNIGAFWSMALLEMRARLITRLGFAEGNNRALQIVTDAMKLDVASPTITQARDSIIAADVTGYGGADLSDIRSGFAARGLGAGASATGTTFLTISESLFPSSGPGLITISDERGNNNGVVDPGEGVRVTIPLTNSLTTTDTAVTANFGGRSSNYRDIAAGATFSRSFTYKVPRRTSCGTLLQVPFTVTSSNGTGSTTIPIQVGQASTSVSFSESFDAVTPPSLPVGWTTTNTGSSTAIWKTAATVIDSANSAFAGDASSSSDSTLTSPTIAIGSGAQQLSFKHKYNTETPWDAESLEIKIGAGSFTDIIAAGGTFVQGGYGATVPSSAVGNLLAGRLAWSGSVSPQTVIVKLPATASNQSVQFRWHVGSDSNTGGTGWNIDSVQVYSTTYDCTTAADPITPSSGETGN
jgi:hypothetical protein